MFTQICLMAFKASTVDFNKNIWVMGFGASNMDFAADVAAFFRALPPPRRRATLPVSQ